MHRLYANSTSFYIKNLSICGHEGTAIDGCMCLWTWHRAKRNAFNSATDRVMKIQSRERKWSWCFVSPTTVGCCEEPGRPVICDSVSMVRNASNFWQSLQALILGPLSGSQWWGILSPTCESYHWVARWFDGRPLCKERCAGENRGYSGKVGWSLWRPHISFKLLGLGSIERRSLVKGMTESGLLCRNTV